MIELKKTPVVGRGGGRDVYIHPLNKNLLIKIYRAHPTRKKLVDYFLKEKRRFGRFREWFVEYDEYIALMSRTNTVPDFIAGLFGFCQTDLGLGQIVERVCDEDTGETSKSIRASVGLYKQEDLLNSVGHFFDKIDNTKVVFRDLNLSNLLVKRKSDGEIDSIVSVDGLGDFTLIQLRRHFEFAHRSWAKRARSSAISSIVHLKSSS